MWKEIKVNDDIYTISTELVDNIWKIILTNLMDLWIESLTRGQIIEKCQKLNPLLDIDDVNIDEILQQLFDNIPQLIAEPATPTKIKLETTVDGGVFKYEIDLKKGSSRQLWQEVTLPLCISVGELSRQKQVLITEIAKRDEEILEYRHCGAELIRKHIQTKPFTEDAIKGEVPVNSIKSCIEVFKSVINNIDVSKVKEQLFKSENLSSHSDCPLSPEASSTEDKSDTDDCKKRKPESGNKEVAEPEVEVNEMGSSGFHFMDYQTDSPSPSSKRKRGRCAFCPRSCDLKTTATCSKCPSFVCSNHKKTFCIKCVSSAPVSPS